MSDATQGALIAMVGGVLLAAIAAYLKVRMAATEAKKDAEEKGKKLDHITVMVNSRMTEALREIAELKQTIAALVPQDREKAQAAVDAAVAADASVPVPTAIATITVPDQST